MTLRAFIEYCSGAVSEEILAMQVFEYLTTQGNIKTLHLLEHSHQPEALRMLQSTHPDYNSVQFIKEYTPLTAREAGYDGPGGFCYLSTDDTSASLFYILAFSSVPDESVLEILSVWKTISKSIRRHMQEGDRRTQYRYADLISQLLHDVHAIMELFPDKKSEAASLRLQYQASVNKKVLRYVRDLELFNATVPLEVFIKDTAQMALDDPSVIHFRIDHKQFPLTGDIDLLAEALKEILDNAVNAVAEKTLKIEITTDYIPSDSPFHPMHWLKITIRDYGKGIIPDFLPYVKKPFFTTDKYLGRSGFGLAIVDKIINAHGGFVDITSIKGQYTDVVLYLPVESSERCDEK